MGDGGTGGAGRPGGEENGKDREGCSEKSDRDNAVRDGPPTATVGDGSTDLLCDC